MKILLYKGNSWVSKLIQFQTRSPYSHAAFMLPGGETYEAWHTGGKYPWYGSVRKLPDPLHDHSAGTVIDVYRLDSTLGFDLDEAVRYAESQLGKRYDFSSVARFVSRREAPSNDALFCSEYVMGICAAGNQDLLHINPAHASPRDIGISPKIFYEKNISN